MFKNWEAFTDPNHFDETFQRYNLRSLDICGLVFTYQGFWSRKLKQDNFFSNSMDYYLCDCIFHAKS